MKSEATHMESTDISGTGENIDYADELLAERGAVILAEERTLSLWQTTKLHWRALLVCSISFSAGLVFGYDVVVNGASISMPAFFIYFGDFGPTGPYLPSIWTSLWTAMSSLCQAIGAYGTGFLLDRFGRRWPGVAAGIITLVGTAVQFTATTRGSLLAGKMVNGLGVGMAMSTATAYASEVAPLKLRSPVQAALVLFTVFMQGVALGVVRAFVPNIAPRAFRTVFAIQWPVGALVTVAFLLAPESPVFLITKQRFAQALKSMTKIYGAQNDPTARLAHLIKTIREEESHGKLEAGTYLECFKGTDLKRTLAVMFIYSTANFAGAAFLAQAIYFLIITGMPAIHAFDVSIGGFGLAVIVIATSFFVVDKFKRRSAFYAGLVVNFIGMIIVGGLYYAKSHGAIWAIAVLMSIMISLQTSTIQGMGWPIAAEISSLRLRGKTISIGIMSQTISTWICLFVTPYMFNVDSGNLGARTGFIWAGTTLLLLIGTYFLVPDLSNMSLTEIDLAYSMRLPARKINLAAVRGDLGMDYVSGKEETV